MGATFDPTKPVQTRDGRKARIVATLAGDRAYPLLAVVTDEEGFDRFDEYAADGRIYEHTAEEHEGDLVNVPDVRVEYCNQLVDGSLGSFTPYPTAAPRARAGLPRLRILKVTTQLSPEVLPPIFEVHSTPGEPLL